MDTYLKLIFVIFCSLSLHYAYANVAIKFDEKKPLIFVKKPVSVPDIIESNTPRYLLCPPGFVLDTETGEIVPDFSQENNNASVLVAEYCQITEVTQEACRDNAGYTWISCLGTCVFTGIDISTP
ncbi:unnamed protein product [Meganyctiphanes norvegica]|uniref:Uncharacterized protein n=1 Tax=Meganyctiphanes norvegica TaxID=48144 RepID=A0AAV2PVC7_MEGNR